MHLASEMPRHKLFVGGFQAIMHLAGRLGAQQTSGKHRVWNCWLTVLRWPLAPLLNLCSCGATGHWAAACPERQRCFHCKEIG